MEVLRIVFVRINILYYNTFHLFIIDKFLYLEQTFETARKSNFLAVRFHFSFLLIYIFL